MLKDSGFSEQNQLTNADNNNIIMEDITRDGGPGSGRYPKGSGEEESNASNQGKNKKWANATDKKAFNEKLIGMMTEADVPVSGIDKHAYNRAVQRGATPDEVANSLGKGKTEIQLPGDKKKGNAPTFQTGSVKVAFDPQTGIIKTIMKEES